MGYASDTPFSAFCAAPDARRALRGFGGVHFVSLLLLHVVVVLTAGRGAELLLPPSVLSALTELFITLRDPHLSKLLETKDP